MTDEEKAALNAAVATALGWQECYTLHRMAAGVPPGKRVCDDNFDVCPRYSEDWSAAGLALDWLAGQDDVVQVEIAGNKRGWRVVIYGLPKGACSRPSSSPTAPEAIARAVVAWAAARQGQER